MVLAQGRRQRASRLAGALVLLGAALLGLGAREVFVPGTEGAASAGAAKTVTPLAGPIKSLFVLAGVSTESPEAMTATGILAAGTASFALAASATLSRRYKSKQLEDMLKKGEDQVARMERTVSDLKATMAVELEKERETGARLRKDIGQLREAIADGKTSYGKLSDDVEHRQMERQLRIHAAMGRSLLTGSVEEVQALAREAEAEKDALAKEQGEMLGEVRSLTDKLVVAADVKADLQAELGARARAVERLEQSTAVMEDVRHELEQQMAVVEEDNEQLKQQVAKAEGEREAFCKERAEMQGEVVRLTERLVRTEGEMTKWWEEQLSDTVEECSHVEELEETLKAAESSKLDAVLRLTSLQDEAAQLEKKLGEEESVVGELVEQRTAAVKEVGKLTQKVVEAEAEKESLRQQATEMEALVIQMEERARDAKRRAANVRQQVRQKNYAVTHTDAKQEAEKASLQRAIKSIEEKKKEKARAAAQESLVEESVLQL